LYCHSSSYRGQAISTVLQLLTLYNLWIERCRVIPACGGSNHDLQKEEYKCSRQRITDGAIELWGIILNVEVGDNLRYYYSMRKIGAGIGLLVLPGGIILILAIIFISSISAYAQRKTWAPSKEEWLKQLQDEIELNETRYREATWNYLVGGEVDKKSTLGAIMLHLLYADESKMRTLKRYQGSYNNEILNRQARLIYIDYLIALTNRDSDLNYLISNSMQIIMNDKVKLRFIEKSLKELDDILQYESDIERRRDAWYAKAHFGTKIKDDLATIVKERNRLARKVDYENYYEMELGRYGLNPEKILRIISVMDSLTAPIYEAIVARDKLERKFAAIEPWDLYYSNPNSPYQSFFRSENILEILDSTFMNMGYPMADLAIKYDIEYRSGKFPSALCLPVHTPDDVRILANVEDGLPSYEALIHETGHALYEKYVYQIDFAFRKPAAPCLTEAIAMMNENIITDPNCLLRYAGMQIRLYRNLSTENMRAELRG